MYLYKARLYKDPVPHYAPASNGADMTDFEDASRKGAALSIARVDIVETTFELDVTYAAFKALVADPIVWSDVKYTENPTVCDLILASEIEL
jgi:hypothetical protein